MSNDRLDALRHELDAVNEKLLGLLNERAALVTQIGDLKQEQGVQQFDPVREKEQLDHLVSINEGPFDDNTVRHLFKQIFQASLGLMEEKQERKLLVSRHMTPDDTVVDLGGVKVGGPAPVIVAGPCSVETPQQMETIGQALQGLGIRLLRGGAFKPRTSPYDFQGLGVEGLKLLSETGKKYGMITISEIMTPEDLDVAAQYIDVIQVGARNMQNFELLKAVGSMKKPVLLKRGLAATIEELLFAAEYMMSRGNDQIILCERGIRTYEKATRNTLDISAVPILKQESHLPVLVDVTHAAGRKDILLPLAKAALAVGANGIMVETHPDPAVALSDAKQQLDIPQFEAFLRGLLASGLFPKESLEPRSME